MINYDFLILFSPKFIVFSGFSLISYTCILNATGYRERPQRPFLFSLQLVVEKSPNHSQLTLKDIWLGRDLNSSSWDQKHLWLALTNWAICFAAFPFLPFRPLRPILTWPFIYFWIKTKKKKFEPSVAESMM
jgi:hypothetical protein